MWFVLIKSHQVKLNLSAVQSKGVEQSAMCLWLLKVSRASIDIKSFSFIAVFGKKPKSYPCYSTACDLIWCCHILICLADIYLNVVFVSFHTQNLSLFSLRQVGWEKQYTLLWRSDTLPHPEASPSCHHTGHLQVSCDLWFMTWDPILDISFSTLTIHVYLGLKIYQFQNQIGHMVASG